MAELNFRKNARGVQGDGSIQEAAAVNFWETGSARCRGRRLIGIRADCGGRGGWLLVPFENTLAGSVVRVYDLLLKSKLEMARNDSADEHQLIGMPGEARRSAGSRRHPMALAQCERFFPGSAIVSANRRKIRRAACGK